MHETLFSACRCFSVFRKAAEYRARSTSVVVASTSNTQMLEALVLPRLAGRTLNLAIFKWKPLRPVVSSDSIHPCVRPIRRSSNLFLSTDDAIRDVIPKSSSIPPSPAVRHQPDHLDTNRGSVVASMSESVAPTVKRMQLDLKNETNEVTILMSSRASSSHIISSQNKPSQNKPNRIYVL